MKLLIILPSSLLGGAERIATSVAEMLLARGHLVTVCTMSKGPGDAWPRLSRFSGFTLIASAADAERRGVMQFLAALPAIRKCGPFDLIYTSHVHTNALASLLMRLRMLQARFLVSRESTRIFDRFHGWRRQLYRALYRFYGRQNLLIFQTEEMRNSLVRHVRLPRRTQQLVLPNPVNLEQVDAALKKPVPHARERPFSMVMCGRLIPLKRVGLLLDALSKLNPQRKWQLTILGDGPLRAELMRQKRALRLTKHVTFLGNVKNPYAHFAAADLGILCSEVEGFPNVLLEMMASGTKQIISTPCTHAVRALPGVDIVEDESAEGLVGHIARIMDEKPDQSRAYRTHIERVHSIETFAQSIFAQLDPEMTL